MIKNLPPIPLPEVGDTLSINHEDCPAGADTRRRLYITRNSASPHRMAVYCHNCQEGGYVSTAQTTGSMDTSDYILRMETESAEFKEPQGILYAEDTEDTQSYMEGHYPILTEYKHSNEWYFYYPNKHAVYFPVFNTQTNDTSEKPIGYQYRPMSSDWTGPRYLTAKEKDKKLYTYMHGRDSDDILFIVEDLMSAFILVSENHRALCLYGTNADPEVLYCAKDDNPSTIIVWLDSDTDHVDNQAHKIKELCRMLYPSAQVYVQNMYVEPKKHTDRTALQEHITYVVRKAQSS